ncbi:MAG: DUF4263 domain-containing protein, partial [Bernardetiaceae bacterium]|nr:DUF4263 domain-containing protein [Bernardetiaceae bacterium]
MKHLDHFAFDFAQYLKELAELGALLQANPQLSEQKQILPFFAARRHLAAQIGSLAPRLVHADKLAFEFDVFGDFTADLVVGDSQKNRYCFIEFEDATEESLFVKRGKKFKPEFSPRLEHGISQLIDWSYQLDVHQHSPMLEERFGKARIECVGLLIIGRSQYLTPALAHRLAWRAEKTVIDSRPIHIHTFDEV